VEIKISLRMAKSIQFHRFDAWLLEAMVRIIALEAMVRILKRPKTKNPRILPNGQLKILLIL